MLRRALFTTAATAKAAAAGNTCCVALSCASSSSPAAAAATVRQRGLRTFTAAAKGGRTYDSILDTIGNTPVVRVRKLLPAAAAARGVELYAKCEFFNPASSVKDRLAIAIIEHAEATGALKPGQTVVEATSGNTGVALAMVCAAKGYPCVITMADSFSVERRRVMRAFGAKVVLTPAAERGSGMVSKARELASEHGYFWARQFENEANPERHANTTGPEILLDFAGRRLDYWVTGVGTGGTFSGAGKVLRAARPDLKIVVTEPQGAAIIESGVQQERQADGAPAATHPAWKPHPIQGWTPDFIAKVAEDGLDAGLMDKLVTVDGPESIATSHRLAREEGIFTGISGGASMAAALKVCDQAEDGSVVLTMLPDTAERYLSTPLFASIDAEMDQEELRLSKSTPGQQYD
eukprot:UC1_evm2s862